MSETITIPEMAERLGISLQQAHAFSACRGFPLVMEGHRKYVRVGELDAWWEKQSRERAERCGRGTGVRITWMCRNCKCWIPDVEQASGIRNYPVPMGTCEKHGFRVERCGGATCGRGI